MADLRTAFLQLTTMKYVDQAKWFLNGFWTAGAEQEAENIWKCANKFIELDVRKKKEGNELDEFEAHKFLESLGETLTVVALRDKLRKIDLDANGKMALLEYLMFKYSKGIQEVIDAPQGDNTQLIEEAQEKLRAVQEALVEVQTKLEEQERALRQHRQAEEAQKRALEEQRRAEEAQKKALEAQRRAEESVRRSEAELRAAVDDLKAQEDNYHNQIQTLERKKEDPSAGQVSKNKAAAELAQLKQENPLPLRRAKITQEAALRKVEKERIASEAATQALEEQTRNVQAKTVALEEETRNLEALTRVLEEQTRQLEHARRETEERFREAQEYLEEVKKQGGVAFGAIWWLERELKEAQKYMPKKKQTL